MCAFVCVCVDERVCICVCVCIMLNSYECVPEHYYRGCSYQFKKISLLSYSLHSSRERLITEMCIIAKHTIQMAGTVKKE